MSTGGLEQGDGDRFSVGQMGILQSVCGVFVTNSVVNPVNFDVLSDFISDTLD